MGFALSGLSHDDAGTLVAYLCMIRRDTTAYVMLSETTTSLFVKFDRNGASRGLGRTVLTSRPCT